MLSYNLKYAGKAEKIIKAAQEKGDPIPEELIPPKLDICNEFYFEAFNELDSERSRFDGGIGAIPWSKIKLYADMYFDKFEDYKNFLDIIREVDGFWVSEINKKTRKEIDSKLKHNKRN